MGQYIGNARVLEVLTANVRDDLVPDGVDGPSPAQVAGYLFFVQGHNL